MDYSAFVWYHQLGQEERDAVDKAVAPLLHRPEEAWPAAGATRLESADPKYLLKPNNSLRAVVRPTPDGKVELLNLFRRELMEFFRESSHAAARP